VLKLVGNVVDVLESVLVTGVVVDGVVVSILLLVNRADVVDKVLVD
jgi:hypothetical protein